MSKLVQSLNISEDPESVQEYLQSFPQVWGRRRKSSFVNLMPDNDGLPELPSLESLPTDISEFSFGSNSPQSELQIQCVLDKCMPRTEEIVKQRRIQKTHPITDYVVSSRNIGGLTPEQRKTKVMKYLEKRRKRYWRKRISYVCRKQVADKRLRIKGRFVTKEYAISVLGSDKPTVSEFLGNK